MRSANTNPLMLSPPKMNIAINTIKVVNEVLNVRPRVEFNASLNTDAVSRLGYRLLYSRTRSKTTTVSFIE